MAYDGFRPNPLNRRRFLASTGVLAAAAAASSVVPTRANMLLANPLDDLIGDAAAPALGALARDTIAGVCAFTVPGGDEYSAAQGVTSETPGGIEAAADEFLIGALDDFLPLPQRVLQGLVANLARSMEDVELPGELFDAAEPVAAELDDVVGRLLESDETVPISLLIAMLLNFLATGVSPGSAAPDPFPSPFANLSYADKVEVFRRFEEPVPELIGAVDEQLTEPLQGSPSGLLQFVAGALLEFSAFPAYSEFHAFDTEAREATQRPIGWDLATYMPGRRTPAEGWDEFIGYFQDRRSVEG